jgi:hypothetical protein
VIERSNRRSPAGASALVLAVLAAGVAGAEEAPSPIAFQEAGARWGIDFVHHHGGSGRRYMSETVVGGTVLFDYDGDGDVDILFVDGAPLPGYEGEPPRSRLFRNDSDRFVDATSVAGIDGFSGYGSGAVAGDVDNDGDLDLYFTALGPNALLLNTAGGSFGAAAPDPGLASPEWSTAASMADIDGDGDLDLFVGNYVDFTPEKHKFCGDEKVRLEGYCHPTAYPGLPDQLFTNLGGGRFEESTAAAGIASDEATLGAIFGDLTGEGSPDLYIANDADPNFLYLNRGDGVFEDASLLSGTSLGESGEPEGGMGLDLGDVDGDGRLDIFVSNFEFEPNALYRNLRPGVFADGRFVANLARASISKLAFGVDLADYDHDGDLDVLVGNGHILDNAAAFDARSSYAQPTQLFENDGRGRFEEVESFGIDGVRVARGLATGDLDRDGDLDVVVVISNGRAEVYENLGGATRPWLLFAPRAGAGDRTTVGTLAVVIADGRRQVRESRTASSYLSQNDDRLHWGLAGAQRVEALDLRWPGGRRTRYVRLPVRRVVVAPSAAMPGG